MSSFIYAFLTLVEYNRQKNICHFNNNWRALEQLLLKDNRIKEGVQRF